MKETVNIQALSNQELLYAILEKKKTRDSDKQTVRSVNRIISEKQLSVKYEDLICINGMGDASAVKILACFEMARRYYPQDNSLLKITRPEDILPLLANIRTKLQEHFCAITVNGAGEVLGNRIITIGLLNHSLVHPREVFSDAITDRAASIIVAHNHPSGSLEPSSQDIAITTQLKEAGSILGISLIDHIIVTKTGHISMKERGLI
jgi:DNA repair protein RadC